METCTRTSVKHGGLQSAQIGEVWCYGGGVSEDSDFCNMKPRVLSYSYRSFSVN